MTQPETIDLGHLSGWIESSLTENAVITESALKSQDAPLAKFVQSTGLFKPSGRLDEVGCPYCETSHACDVMQDGDSGYKARCLFNGWFPVDASAVTLLTFDRIALLGLISEACGLGRQRGRPFADGHLIQLGLVTSLPDAKDFMLGYADGLAGETVLSAVMESLRTAYGQGPGIILTPSRVPETMPLPGKHKLLSLNRALVGLLDKMALAEGVVTYRLGERRVEKGRPGVKGQKGISYQVWLEQHVLPDWPVTRPDQAKRISDKWPAGSERTIGLSTLQNHLPEFEDGKYPRPTN